MIRQILGEVSVPVANTEVQQVIENPGIVKTYLEKYMPSLISFLVQLVVAIVILLIGIKVIKSVVKIIKKGFDKSRMDAAVASFLANMIKYFLYFILVMALLSGFGVATGSVIAVLGSAGLTVGMALQGSLSNFAGGVLILLMKPFGVGDYIVDGSSGTEGTVKDINLFYTRLLTIDNKMVMIPNGKLADSCITNVSMMDKRMLDLRVTVSYSTNLAFAKSVLESVVKDKRIVLVDDSIVRGTTIANLIHMLKEAGAKEVHVRISSPPFISECYFGTDIPSKDQLIANHRTIDEIRDVIGCDSLGYLKVERLEELSGGQAICKGCFTGEYPLEPPTEDIRGVYQK